MASHSGGATNSQRTREGRTLDAERALDRENEHDKLGCVVGGIARDVERSTRAAAHHSN